MHTTKASLLRSDAHQGRFLPFENLRAGLRVSLPSIFLGVVSPSNHSRTLSLSNRGLINFGSGLTIALNIALGVLDSYHLKKPYATLEQGVLNELPRSKLLGICREMLPLAPHDRPMSF